VEEERRRRPDPEALAGIAQHCRGLHIKEALMNLEGFVPYKPEDVERYEKKRWWLGMTMGDVLDKASDVFPQKEALVGGDKRYTYAQVRRLIDRMAYRLYQEGLRRGDRVLLQLPNLPEFYIAYFALQKAGCIVVLLTVNHTAREVSHLAALTQPRGWILPAQYRKTAYEPLVKQVQKDNPGLEKVVFVGDTVPDGILRFDALLETDADEQEIRTLLETVRPDPTDVLQILPSGGTTGLPKGAPRTHNDYLCNVEYKAHAWDMNVHDVCMAASTAGHNLALLVCVTAPVLFGAKVVMLDSTRPEDFCDLVQREKVTCACAVPTIVSRIVHSDKLGNYDLSSLSKFYVGAAHSAPELVTSVEKKLGCRYVNAFGMVEGPCMQSRPDYPFEVICSSTGKPVCPYDEFVTLDPNGNRTAAGVEGELAAKGPGIFTGYFKNPKANETSYTPEGYFRTGDLAMIDPAGYIRITGRIKDIIIRGGENISAQEIEELLLSHPLVENVSVVSMPHPDLGEEVCAYLKTAGGIRVELKDVHRHLAELGASKLSYPARLEFVDDMPLTAAGKIDKKVLRERIREKLKAEGHNGVTA
jgi:2,3-dihydroxybenzoate-AMP ligase